MSIKSDLVDEIFEREWGKDELRKEYFTAECSSEYEPHAFDQISELYGEWKVLEIRKEISGKRSFLKDLALKEVKRNPSLISDIIAKLPCYEYHQVSFGIFVTHLPTGFKFDNENGSVFIKEEDFIKHTSFN